MKIAIASGKGGTGKTTLAVNLAKYASEGSNVLLADLDVEEPNSGIFLHGELLHHKTMKRMIPEWQEGSCISCGKCREWCRFNAIIQLGETILVLPELCHSCYACSELCPAGALKMVPEPLGELSYSMIDDLHFIESRLNIGIEQSVPLISQTIDYLAANCSGKEFEFWDSPPGTSCPLLAVTYNADFVILATEPTPFGLYDLNLAVDAMELIRKPMAVVINRYGIGNDDVLKFCQERGLPIWAKIPNQRSIAELYARGELIYPSVAEFRRELDEILYRLRSLKKESCAK